MCCKINEHVTLVSVFEVILYLLVVDDKTQETLFGLVLIKRLRTLK